MVSVLAKSLMYGLDDLTDESNTLKKNGAIKYQIRVLWLVIAAPFLVLTLF